MASCGIQIPGRLIGKKNRWTGCGRPRNRHPLLLPTRHLRRIMIKPVPKPNGCQLGRSPPKRIGYARQLQWHRNILQRSHRRNQMERLQHNADPPAPRFRQPVLIQRTEILSRHLHRPAGCPLQPGQQRHQRRFTRSGWSQNRHRLTGPNLKVDATQNLDLTGQT